MVTGYFYKHLTTTGDWGHIYFSCLDSPLVTKEYIELMKQEYGEIVINTVSECSQFERLGTAVLPRVRGAIHRFRMRVNNLPCILGLM